MAIKNFPPLGMKGNTLIIKAERSIGNTQYPNKHILWNKDLSLYNKYIFAPRKRAL